MKRLILTIFLIAGLFLSCRQHVKTVPEITPAISADKIFDLKTQEEGGKIIKNGPHLVVISLTGLVTRFDPGKKDDAPTLDLAAGITPDIFQQNGFALVKQKKDPVALVIDLAELKIAASLESTGMEKILGLDREMVVFQGKNKLFIFNYRQKKLIEEFKFKKDQQFFSVEITPDSLLILSDQGLYTYRPATRTLTPMPLKIPAVSGFLLDDGYIYYGSENRKLVKYSLKSEKIVWQLALPAQVTLPPQRAGRFIMVAPEDNNIYFFTPRGGLYWWTKLDSRRVFSPVVMQDNLAVLVMNRQYRKMNNQIRFINFKKKQVTSYQFRSQTESPPVFHDGRLYILALDTAKEKEEKGLYRIGNRYDLDVTIAPEWVKPQGKSIRIELTPINLIEPQIEARIVDQANQTLAEKKFAPGQSSIFVWIPDKTGPFQLTAVAKSQNQPEIKTVKSFLVSDVASLTRAHFRQVQKKCSHDPEQRREDAVKKPQNPRIKKQKVEQAQDNLEEGSDESSAGTIKKNQESKKNQPSGQQKAAKKGSQPKKKKKK